MGHQYIVSGEVIGEREVKIRRYNTVVTEYLVRPADGVTNLSKHIVDKSDVVKIEPCPRCNGTGILSVKNGDDDQQCPACQDIGEVVY
jgi:hypothetical protein